MSLANTTVGEFRLGRLRRPSGEFPNGQWCAVWGGKANRRRYGLGIGLERDKSVAVAALAEFARRRQAATVAVSATPLAAIVEAYIADRRNAGRQIKNAECHWKALATVFGHMQPEGVEAPMMVDGKMRTACHLYAVERTAQGKSRDTVWSELLFLRTVLNWAVKADIISKAPKVWVPSKGPARNVLITEDEAWQLIEGCRMPHVRLFVIVALCTAARSGAILELTWERVDFERGIVDFNKPEKRDILDSGFKKGRSIVPMNDLLRAALSEAKTGARTKFVIEWDGQQVGSIKTGFNAAIKRAGLEGRGITPHVLRHAAASWIANANVPMRMIQKLLGHKTERTTETIYANKTGQEYLTGATNVIGLKMERK